MPRLYDRFRAMHGHFYVARLIEALRFVSTTVRRDVSKVAADSTPFGIGISDLGNAIVSRDLKRMPHGKPDAETHRNRICVEPLPRVG